jgi:hypothetical protein
MEVIKVEEFIVFGVHYGSDCTEVGSLNAEE